MLPATAHEVSPHATAEVLDSIVEELTGEFQLRSVLERILERATELMGCDAGSIARVDEVNGTYRKVADIGVRCQSGHVFSLREGMTGEVARRRQAVWFDRYDEVPGGHISAEDRKTLRGVIGVPLEWRGSVIGACVVFSRDESRRFGEADARLLGQFARYAAIAIANASMYEAVEERARLEAATSERERLIDEMRALVTGDFVDLIAVIDRALEAERRTGGTPRFLQEARASVEGTLASLHSSLSRLREPLGDERSLEDIVRTELEWAERARTLDAKLVVIGTPVPLKRSLVLDIGHVARELIDNVVQHASARTLRFGIVYDSASLSLLVQDDGRGFDVSTALAGPGEERLGIVHGVRDRGGTIAVDSSVGWGTSVRAVFPYRREDQNAIDHPAVLVVAPTELVRAGLSRMLVWSEQPIDVAAEASTAQSAVDAAVLYRPTAAVVSYPTVEELIETIEALTAAQPELAIVAVCPDDAPGITSAAVQAGARGCVVLSSDRAVLADAVIATTRGQSIMPAATIWGRGPRSSGAGLTSREQEVCALLERGLSDKAIAAQLVISTKTVEKHVSAVLRKMRVRSRAELAALAKHARIA